MGDEREQANTEVDALQDTTNSSSSSMIDIANNNSDG